MRVYRAGRDAGRRWCRSLYTRSDVRKAELICSSFYASPPVKLLAYAWMRCFEYCTTRVINRCSFVRNNTDESAVSTGITVDNNQLMPQRKEQGPGSVRQSVMTCVWVKCKQRDTLRRLCHVRQAIDQQLDQTKFGLNLYAKSITSN